MVGKCVGIIVGLGNYRYIVRCRLQQRTLVYSRLSVLRQLSVFIGCLLICYTYTVLYTVLLVLGLSIIFLRINWPNLLQFKHCEKIELVVWVCCAVLSGSIVFI